jgi:5-methylcytosine-specific restriction endonuclease McrA
MSKPQTPKKSKPRTPKKRKLRTPIPEDISAQVMFQHDRTCCVCHEPGRAVQIHHIDDDPTNHAISNLAVLCLEHHEQTQTRGGFAKKLKVADVEQSRDDWIRRVRVRREKTDKLAI